MKNRLLTISIGILLTSNTCFSMNDPKEDARRIIYNLVQKWQATKASYDKKKSFYRGELDKGSITEPVYRRRMNASQDDAIIDFNYIKGEIQKALHNYNLPESYMYYTQVKGDLLSKLRFTGSLSEKDIYDLVEKYYR